MINVELGGLLGLVVLVLDVWAMVSVMHSGVSTGSKVFWIVVVLLLPVLGLVLWFLFGPRGR